MTKLFVPVNVDSDLTNLENLNLDQLYPAKSFGRVPFYAMIESNTNEIKLIPNTNHHYGGKDRPWDIVINNGANAIFAIHLCEKPYTKFKEQNISIFSVEERLSLRQIVNSYKEGKLNELSPPEPGSGCSGDHNHNH